jgi:hypothetical protein
MGAPKCIDDTLVARHGKRGKNKIGLELFDAFDIDAEVGADTRSTANDLGRIVGMIVDSHQHLGATERADNFGIGTGVTYDSQLTFLRESILASLSRASGSRPRHPHW